jgi:antitoxin (DNA-binding transcriptional repressor) of toxin-antitoxin stability system
MEKISATELARNTRQILDRVVGLGEIIAIERNHTLIAQILPAERTMTAGAGVRNAARPARGRISARPQQARRPDHTVRDPWA